ncbi:hypothetical protein [Staphylococcus petrasii]|uniref:hypothetical protein n=1 Tax=Staphylococcus petrasii TaxID=1276936 RepID=UPI001F58C3AC|nr:hypothetical protein [Staphylococcus petrasii]MCI2773826.1 hypothetical protein [Staphylococcus petrasii]
MEDLRKSYYHKQADYYGNKNENIASSLSYLSVFFAPVILPIIMWIVASPPVSTHARKALFNHIMTWVCFALVPFALMFFAGGMNSATTNTDNLLVFISWTIAVILVVTGIYLFIVNIVRGIKLLLV